MADKDAATPRVFLIRHGQTEWSRTGQHTGTTDIPLTRVGEAQVTATGHMAYGKGKLIDPSNVARVYVSPRTRATKTYELLSGQSGGYQATERLAEWDYGEYEGLQTHEIRARRAARGLDRARPWDIWRDGCEGGETPSQVTQRVDALIAEIRTLHAPLMAAPGVPKDVILVAHGHLTRALAKRWLGYDLSFPLGLMMEPGGLGILSYQHANIDEPAVLLGMAFPVRDVSGTRETSCVRAAAEGDR